MGLAPTASTTAALAMGDALAVVLINSRRFSTKDFRKFHPGGHLGERLGGRVKEVMLTGAHIPMVLPGAGLAEVLREMDTKGIGATFVVDDSRGLLGIITDGDLRRSLLRQENIAALRAEEVMSPSPRTIDKDQTAAEALGVMELYGITHLGIVDRQNRLRGVVHLHDLLGREDFKLNGGNKRTARAHTRSDHPA